VTPDGNPLSDTCTSPEKPFWGVMLTLTALLVLPCETETVGEEKLMTKSGAGGGGGGSTNGSAPPPQPTDNTIITPAEISTGTGRKRPDCRAQRSNRPIRSPHFAPKRHKHTPIYELVKLRNIGDKREESRRAGKRKTARTLRSRRLQELVLRGS